MTSDTGVITEEDIRRIVRDEVTKAFAKDPATRKAAIVASKGTLDWAYPPLILASSAAAIGMDASVFFTFYGLNIIHKDAAKKLKVDPVGNPAMPMPVPIPDIVSSLPGDRRCLRLPAQRLHRRRRVRRRHRLHGASPPGPRHHVHLSRRNNAEHHRRQAGRRPRPDVPHAGHGREQGHATAEPRPGTQGHGHRPRLP